MNNINYNTFDWQSYIKTHTHIKTKKEAYHHYSSYGKIINDNKCTINTYDNNALLYVIYHDDISYSEIEKYKNIDNIKLLKIKQTKYFESIFFEYLYDNKNEWIFKKYVGMVTYSFEKKTNQNIIKIFDKINNYNSTNNDMIILIVAQYNHHRKIYIKMYLSFAR